MPEFSSAGTLVATALETAGYVYQSNLLDKLTGVLTGKIGGFVYLIGICVALFAYATRGVYQLTTWLLIGPPLFFAMIVPRTESEEARWIYAKQNRNQQQVDQSLKELLQASTGTSGSAPSMNVSTVFYRYNKLVSVMVQEIMAVINSERQNSDKMFIFRGQVYGSMYSHFLEEPNLKAFIQESLLGACSNFVRDSATAQDEQSPTTFRSAALARMAALDEFSIRLGDKSAWYVTDVLHSMTDGVSASPLDSTFDIFRYDRNGDNALPVRSGTELADKLSLYSIVKEKTLSCRQVWDIAYYGLTQYAKTVEKRIEQSAQSKDIDIQQFKRELGLAAFGREGASNNADYTERLIGLIAKYILRNEIFKGNSTWAFSSRLEQGRSAPYIQADLDSEMVRSERVRMAQTEWAERGRLLTAASNLPYYQGLGLYFLAIFFPFFALLLLVPGKHSGFLLWFVLWLWLKSWDIGFSVVMLLDDVLFALFSTQKFKNVGLDDVLSRDFATAIWAIKNSDPSFAMSTYYTLLGVALSSVPVISSQLILGSLSGGAGLVAAGVSQMSDFIGRSVQSSYSQNAINVLKQQMYENKMQSAMSNVELQFGAAMPLNIQQRRAFTNVNDTAKRNEIMAQYLTPVSEEQLQKLQLEPNAEDYENRRAGLPDNNEFKPHIALSPQGNSIGQTTFDSARRGLNTKLGALTMAQGTVRGFSAGYVGRKFRDRFSPVANAINSADKLGDALSGSFGDLVKAELDLNLAWTTYKEVYGDESRRLVKHAKYWGMLEVPWTQGGVGANDTPYEAEGDMDYARFSAWNRITLGVIDAARQNGAWGAAAVGAGIGYGAATDSEIFNQAMNPLLNDAAKRLQQTGRFTEEELRGISDPNIPASERFQNLIKQNIFGGGSSAPSQGN